MKKRRECLSKHHTVPRSRGGTDESIVMLPPSFHEALHFLFGNLTTEEIHIFLEIVLEPGTAWTRKDIHELIEKIKEENDRIEEEEIQ